MAAAAIKTKWRLPESQKLLCGFKPEYVTLFFHGYLALENPPRTRVPSDLSMISHLQTM